MAIILPSGFNILNNEPVDARITLADESTRYALSSANVYEGLIVFQQDNDTIWVLTDTSNVGNSNGWTQLQIGSVDSNLPSGVVSGSDQLTSSYDSRYVNETDFTSFSSSVDTRLDQIESVTASLDSTFEEKASGTHTLVSGSSQVIGILDSLNLYTQSNDTTNSTQNSRLDQLSTYTGSNETAQSTQNSRLSSLETKTGSLDTEQSTQNSRLDQIELVTASLDSTYEEKASGTHTLVSGSDQLSGSLVDLISDQTINGTKTFNDIVVNGTGSFAYIKSVDGEAKIIGDSYIILNNDTPTQRYAGIAVYDSGSVTPTTASFNFDGQTNDWFYEYSASTVDYGVVLFGPEYNTKGNPTYLTENRIPKAEGTHHLNDSNISDDGTTITLGSNSVVNGTLYATGTTLVSGSSQISYPNLSNIPAGIVSGSSQVTPLLPSGVVSGSSQVNADSITNFDTNVKDKLNTDGVISGSSQVNADTITNFDTNVKDKLNIDGVISGSSQVTLSGDITGTANNTAIGTGVIVNADVNASAAIAYTKLNLGGSNIVSGSTQIDALGFLKVGGDSVISGSSQVNADTITNFDANVLTYNNSLGVVSGSAQITKTLQQITTAGNTTSTSISITNSTASTSKTTGALVVTGGIGTSGDIFAGGDVVAYASSDIRLKNNLELISNPLQKINQIGGYSFYWNVEKQNIYSGKDYGVIAQEIEEILPELVDTRENGYKAVKYDKLVSLLIEGIKDLSKQVEDLKEKINKG